MSYVYVPVRIMSTFILGRRVDFWGALRMGERPKVCPVQFAGA
jgi:hypothetical protein